MCVNVGAPDGGVVHLQYTKCTQVADLLINHQTETGKEKTKCRIYTKDGRQLKHDELVHCNVEDGGMLEVVMTDKYVFDNRSLRAAVKEWMHDEKGAKKKYGHISNWDVADVTDMSYLFCNAYNFNQPLNSWNVSSVTNMSNMFCNAHKFNKPLDKWDVSSVTDMSDMFSDACDFDHPLDKWDVSSVTDMSDMFCNAHKFNKPLNKWDVSSVTDMSNMFCNACGFNQPLNSWDVSSETTNMSSMFFNASNFYHAYHPRAGILGRAGQ